MRNHDVVGFTAEPQTVGEPRDDILGPFNPCHREFVQQPRIRLVDDGRERRGRIAEPLVRAVGARQSPAAVFVEQLGHQLVVERPGIEVLQSLPAALVIDLDEGREQRNGPTHATFKDGEVEIGEAAGHAAEEQATGKRGAGLREVADLIEHVG